MSKIKNITVVDGSTSQRVTVPAAISQIYYNDKNNLNIETTVDDIDSNGKGGKINIESASDIQLKPGDDIIFYSHHRGEGKQNEVSVKVTDGNDNPVKLQLNASEAVLTTKDKIGTDANVFDLTVNSTTNTRGYLKVRAQAIDLRSESHGGIALQPKGNDGEGHMNKIKFEHGGGDGLEFGTFNTEKTSIFTDEYRFNKDGIWKMATREKEESDKKEIEDPTTHYKYKKQVDDFYDKIDENDEQCTTNDIIKTASAFNGGKDRHTKITSKGNLEIATTNIYYFEEIAEIGPGHENDTLYTDDIVSAMTPIFDHTKEYTLQDLKNHTYTGITVNDVINTVGMVYNLESKNYIFKLREAPSINIESDNNITFKAADKINFKGQLDFGSSFNFGETDEGINYIYKYTAKGNEKNCGIIKVVAVNNHATNSFTTKKITNTGDTYNELDVTIPAGTSQTIASCNIYDIIKLVNYMKYTKTGPWV